MHPSEDTSNRCCVSCNLDVLLHTMIKAGSTPHVSVPRSRFASKSRSQLWAETYPGEQQPTLGDLWSSEVALTGERTPGKTLACAVTAIANAVVCCVRKADAV